MISMKRTIFLWLFFTVECKYEDIHRPCHFNPLCACSNAGPDLGSVNCINVPFISVPPSVKYSAIYIMNLQNNKLRVLQDYSFNGTDLWKLQINKNLLTTLRTRALFGLEKSLSILDLNNNEIIGIPKDALSKLVKIQTLNLAKNKISTIHTDDIFQLGKTLKDLDLSENSLSYIHNDAFRNMESLEHLNLAKNSIISINDVLLNNRFYHLKSINLMGNQLRQIPFTALTNLRKIRSINLSKNFIYTLLDAAVTEKKMTLDELNLGYNLLEELPTQTFKSYSRIDRIYLDGNPLKVIRQAAFLGTNVAEIYLSDCMLSYINSDAFQGVERSVQMLDLSYNNLTSFPRLPLLQLGKLNFRGNKIYEIHEDLTKIGASLKYLDISGSQMGSFETNIVKHVLNIRYLSFKKVQNGKLTKEDLMDISPTLEELHLTNNFLHAIEKDTFTPMTALKVLNLSYNQIKIIADDAFKDMSHSLEKLILHNALTMSIFPEKVFNHLTNLEYLDLSNNHLTTLSHDSFAAFEHLKHINLNHNEISELNSNHFNKKNIPDIRIIKLAFNKIKVLNMNSFTNLKKLLHLELHDNLIQVIKRSSFVDLDSLISINLEGNNIINIENEAFQNLPNIQKIDFSNNWLTYFNLNAFHQVGRLSMLRININHNKITELSRNYSSGHTSSNIKILTFSHNNISQLDMKYFDSVRHSIISLDLSVNKVENITDGSLNEMEHLQILTLDFNNINYIKEDSFDGLKNLQILNVSQNKITSLMQETFRNQKKLRILDISNNKIEALPEYIFQGTALEQLNIAKNYLITIPTKSLSYINKTLQYLDISENLIEQMTEKELLFLKNLKQLILSKNKLYSFEMDFAECFPTLISLDLSSNQVEDNTTSTLQIEKLPEDIENINLANTSLSSIPDLYTSGLLSLNLSHNSIYELPQEKLINFSSIRYLDLSGNKLQDIHKNVWSNLNQLQSLHIGSNMISNFKNDSFVNLKKLQLLKIQNLDLQDIDSNTFHALTSLKQLEMDTYPNLKGFNLSELLHENYGIREVHLHVQEEKVNDIFKGMMPKALDKITLEGMQLKKLEDTAFKGFMGKNLVLNIHTTNITRLSWDFLTNTKSVDNFTAVFKNDMLHMVEKSQFYLHKKDMTEKLKKLELSSENLICDCSFNWLWQWIKEYEYVNECFEEHCYGGSLSDLRNTKCINQNNSSIVDVFKTELQCFSGAWTNRTSSILLLLQFVFIVSVQIAL